jgi:hypothetical protein
MCFELADYDAEERGIGAKCLLINISVQAIFNWGEKGEKYHETQIPPLVQEISIYVDTVRLAQILGDQGADGGEVLLFERVLILNVPQFGG